MQMIVVQVAVFVSLVVILFVWLLIRQQTKPAAESQADTSAIAAPTKQLSQPKPNALIVGPVDSPGIMIQAYELGEVDLSKPLKLRNEQVMALETLVRHVPSIALAGANLVSQTYVVRFAPEIAAKLAGGSAKLMRSLEGGARAIAVGADGRILGHGTLIASALNPIVVATAVWQMLAMVTAQYYLVGINRRLAAIEGKLDALHQRMDDQDAATVVNNFKRLKSIQSSLASGRLTELDVQSFVGEVDAIDRECGRIMEMYMIAMNRTAGQVRTMNLKGTFHPADKVHVATQQIGEYTGAAQMWAIATTARVVAAEVRCALPVDIGIAQRRLGEVQDELDRWEQEREGFYHLVKSRAQDVSTAIHVKWWEQDQEHRKKLARAANQSKGQLNESHRLIARGLVDIQEHTREYQALAAQPLNLLLDINTQGEISNIRQLVTPMTENKPNSIAETAQH